MNAIYICSIAARIYEDTLHQHSDLGTAAAFESYQNGNVWIPPMTGRLPFCHCVFLETPRERDRHKAASRIPARPSLTLGSCVCDHTLWYQSWL